MGVEDLKISEKVENKNLFKSKKQSILIYSNTYIKIMYNEQ